MRNADVSVVDDDAREPQAVVECAKDYVISFSANVAKDIESEARMDQRPPEQYLRILIENALYGHARHSAHIPFSLPPKTQRTVLKARERSAIFERDGGICQLCHTAINGKWHIDHIKRVRDGGDNSPGNLRLTCEACNLGRNKFISQ